MSFVLFVSVTGHHMLGQKPTVVLLNSFLASTLSFICLLKTATRFCFSWNRHWTFGLGDLFVYQELAVGFDGLLFLTNEEMRSNEWVEQLSIHTAWVCCCFFPDKKEGDNTTEAIYCTIHIHIFNKNNWTYGTYWNVLCKKHNWIPLSQTTEHISLHALMTCIF